MLIFLDNVDMDSGMIVASSLLHVESLLGFSTALVPHSYILFSPSFFYHSSLLRVC